jgi:hypothetical protein
MPTVLEFNADAIADLGEYQSRARCLRRGTADRATAMQEAVVRSRGLMATVDADSAEAADAAAIAGWLWPAY